MPTPTTPIENQKSKIENSPLPAPSPLFPIGHLTLLLGPRRRQIPPRRRPRRTPHHQLLPPPHPSQPRPPLLPREQRTRNFSPGTIIYLSTEDDIPTLDTRLAAAGADPELTLLPPEKYTLHHPDERADHPPFRESLKRGLLPPPLIYWLASTIEKYLNPRLLILDPLPAFLGLKDSSNAALIRRLLDPLLTLAQSQRFAILGLSHLTKSARPHTPHLHRALGSIAYTALARSVLLLDHDPDPKNPNRRLLHHLKNNRGPLHPPLAFSITTPQQQMNNEQSTLNNPPPPILVWDQTPIPNTLTLPTIDPPENPADFLQSQLDDALHFLTTSLTDGPLPSAQLLKEARSLAINPRTLTRAKYLLHIRSHRDPHSRQWLTSLPTPTN